MTEPTDVSDMVEVQKYPGGAVTPAAVSMPERLLAIAINKGASLEQLRELMDLQERQQANIARQQFHAAMVSFKRAGVPEILKTKLVEHSGISYRHATLNDAVVAIVPALAQHGISHDWTIHQNGEHITVACVLTHEAGYSKSVGMTASADQSGKKNAIQGIASAISYMQRYTLLSATGLATQEMGDDDGKGGDDARDDRFRLNEWIEKAAGAPDIKELQAIMEQGNKVIRAREDVPAFEAFKKAIQTRRTELDPDYASKLAAKKATEKPVEREPGSEG